MLNPAKTVIEICGGIKAVAKITNRNEIAVRRWGYTKARGGSDGLIPSDCQRILMDAASKKGSGIELKADHFFIKEPLRAKNAQSQQEGSAA